MMGIGKWKLFKGSNTSETTVEVETEEAMPQEEVFHDCKSYRLMLEGTTVELKVHSPFEKMEGEEEMEWGSDDLERFADATFTREEECNMVTCYLHTPHVENYANAEEYVKYYLADCSDG